MKEVKTREHNNAPRVLSDAARAPKELAKRSIIQAKAKAREATQSPETQQDETPEQYAENRVERTTEMAVHKAGEHGKAAVRSVNDTRKRVNEIRKEVNHRKTSQTRQQTNSYRAGRERVVKNARHSAGKTIKQSARTTAKKTVKTAKHSVKAAEKTVKTTSKAAKAAAKATEKTAQAAAKAAQAAVKAAQAAAKAAAAAAKAAAKAIAAVIKWIIAAVKALIAAIAAGGWVAVVIIVVVVLVVALLAVFGVFSSNEAPDGSKPLTEAIETIDSKYQEEMQGKIAELTTQFNADVVELIFEGDMESLDSSAPNLADVVGVYATKLSLDTENPSDITVVTEENITELEAIFYDMNSVSYRTETETVTTTVVDEFGAIVYDEEGEPQTESTTTLYIYIDSRSLDYREGSDLYRFNAEQDEMLTELMRPDYYPLFAELLGDTVGDGGEYGFGFTINPDLTASELGAQIVEAAKKYIGRSYSSMDCSKLARTAYSDCGLSSMNGLSSVYMAKKCEEMGVLFTDPSQLQAGDLIFFSRFDPSKGSDYCGDVNRCGTGKCKRWMHIHHVAIYINDEFLIDSTGGKNSVQIRKHWGMDTSKWKWVCFGRPTS